MRARNGSGLWTADCFRVPPLGTHHRIRRAATLRVAVVSLERVAFVGPTGWGNLGDAAIIESLIHGIRLRHPNAQILGLTQRPYDTTSRHAVPAFTCSGLSLPKYKMDERAEAEVASEE